MQKEQPEIYWNKLTGKNEMVIPQMSMVVMTELMKALTHPTITKDQAVAQICLSELSEEEKVIVAVNIGEYKERTKISQWIWLKYYRSLRLVKSFIKAGF